MTDRARDLLQREQRFLGQPCTLWRFWETDIGGRAGEPEELPTSHTFAVIVYAHGYASPDLASQHSLRFAVYDGDRQLGAGIIA